MKIFGSCSQRAVVILLLLAFGLALGGVGMYRHAYPVFEARAGIHLNHNVALYILSDPSGPCLWGIAEQIKSRKVVYRALDELAHIAKFPADRAIAY